jgi:hypothetical protein
VHVDVADRVLCVNGPADDLLVKATGPQGTVILIKHGQRRLKYRLTDSAVGTALGWARAAEYAEVRRYG